MIRRSFFLILGVIFASTVYAPLVFASCTAGSLGSHSTDFGFGLITQDLGASAFTAGCSGVVSSSTAVFEVAAGAPSDDVQVTLQSDTGGAPSGTVLATSNTIDVQGALHVYTITFPVAGAVTNGSVYWLVYGRTGANSGSDFYGWDVRTPTYNPHDQAKSGTWSEAGTGYNGRILVDIEDAPPSAAGTATTTPSAQDFIQVYGNFLIALCSALILLAILKVIYDVWSTGGILST